MSDTKYPYAPHGFLADVGVDFKGLTVPAGTEIYLRIADWVHEKKCSTLIPPWSIESAALLYHIVFGCDEKRKNITDANERRAWMKIQKSHTDMAYRSWRQIWRTVAENSASDCGRCAADEICLLFREYNRTLLVSEKPQKRRKPKFDFELSDLPEWKDD